MIATIDGVHVDMPLSYFHEIMSIGRTPFDPKWWQENCLDCQSLDISINGWIISIEDYGQNVLQVAGDGWLNVCVSHNFFMQLMYLKRHVQTGV